MAGISPHQKVERRGFFKINPILTTILLIIFIPISILVDLCFLFTKLNSGIPTFFNVCAVESTIAEENLGIEVGDMLLFNKQSDHFIINSIVLYYEPTAEESETGSKPKVGILKEISNDGETVIYGIKGESV